MKLCCILIGTLFMAAAAFADAADHLVHQWTFNDGTGNDSVGTAHGTLHGKAWIGNGALYLLGNEAEKNNNENWMKTAPLGGTLEDRTLVAWCALATPVQSELCGGSILSVGTAGNVADCHFDGIVYGEYGRTARQWMNGSDYWRRSPADNGGELETVAAPQEVMIAITYSKDPYRVTIYRNGKLYAAHSYLDDIAGWRPAFPTLGEDSVALFGPRSAKSGYFNGSINEARIYDAALTAEEVAALYAEGPVPSLVTTPWNGSFETNSPWATAEGVENEQTDNFTLVPGWFTLDPGVYDTRTGFARLGCGLTWCPPATEGATLVWIEAPSKSDAQSWETLWSDQQKPYIASGSLGNIQTGESYRVQADVASGNVANPVIWFNRPLVELVDGANGDVLASWGQWITTEFTTVNVDFTSPPMPANRAGHPLFVRVTVNTHGLENIPDRMVMTSVDNVRVTAIPGTAPQLCDEVFTGTVTDLMVSDASNWAGAVAPTGHVGTIRFENRGSERQTTLNVDVPLIATNLVFEQEGPRAVRQFLDTYTGRFTLHDMGCGTPTVSVSDGFVILDSLTANEGFVKTGAGTLQLGGFLSAAGTIEVREGRLSIGDDLAHRWSFNDGTGRDLVGLAHGSVSGEAQYTNSTLHLPGGKGESRGAFVTEETGRWINSKTLVVWTKMDEPKTSTAGSALAICSSMESSCVFDGIVYGEITPQYWMAGSDNWSRTQQEPQYGYPEEDAGTNLVMVALSHFQPYGQTYISRNGRSYTKEGDARDVYSMGTPSYDAQAHVIMGPRHFGNQDTYLGWIEEARIYRHNLDLDALAELAAKGPNAAMTHSPTAPLPKDLDFKVAPGAILDLNMMEYTARSFTGAGTLQNGLLRVTDKLTITGPLTVEDPFSIEPGATVTFSTDAAAIKVNGPLTLPAQAKLRIDLPGPHISKRKMTLFSSTTPVDWSVLDNWDFEPPEIPCYRFTEFPETDKSGHKFGCEFGYDIKFVGGIQILIR